MAHARRKFDELVKIGHSPMAMQAVQRIAALYRIEHEARAKPLCQEMQVWPRLQRNCVPDGSTFARAIDYSLNR